MMFLAGFACVSVAMLVFLALLAGMAGFGFGVLLLLCGAAMLACADDIEDQRHEEQP